LGSGSRCCEFTASLRSAWDEAQETAPRTCGSGSSKKRIKERERRAKEDRSASADDASIRQFGEGREKQTASHWRFSDGQTLDDERLVGAAKIGHKAAFDELSRRHAKKIFHVAHRITRNRQDAEDVVQESFVRAFIHLKSFDGRSRFSTWLTRIAINSALMSLRKNRRSPEVPMEERIEPSEPWHQQFADPDPSLNPEKRFAKHERETILRRAISKLRPRMREVVEIHLQEYSLNDTANALGISLNAAKGRLFHARGILRRAMKS
jgi:RNA polymerase sigma factor (sigma-70 family)